MMLKIAQPGSIVSLLNKSVKPICFLGAGASKQSGVKLVVEIVEEAAKWAYCDVNGISVDDPRLTMSDWKKWLTKFSWYTDDYSALYPIIIEELLNPRQTRKDFFLKIINPDIPSSRGYEILCELMHLELIDTVLTGNFDNCLHNASIQVRKPPFIQSIKTPFDLSTFSYTPKYPQLIYLHGSVEHYTDQNLINEIQTLNPQLSSTLKPLLKDRPLFVIGYRGSEPSVMKNLFLDNLSYTNNFHQGIYWCILRRDLEQVQANESLLTPHLKELVKGAGNNFQFIPIDGFDELMTKEIWGKLRATQIDLKAKPVFVQQNNASAPSYDTRLVGENTIGALEVALLRERIKNYCSRLDIKVYEEDWWLYQQMVRLKVAELVASDKYELTSSGILLFSSKTQEYLPQAYTILRFEGSEEWLREVTSFSSEREVNFENLSTGTIDRRIEGNIWNQLNEITDSLTLINRPFRLKGELSENVYPYPTLALKEIIVNSLVHRDYSILNPVIIRVSADRIVFTSPGGLVEEVKRQLLSESLEDEIRKGKRGIKGYRNPVLADLFYGAGAMDKEGSGLSDVVKQVMNGGSAITFGPTDNEASFEVVLYRRIEEVDKATLTATPSTTTTTTTAISVKEPVRFACNLFEILKLPRVIYHADTDVRRRQEIYSALNNAWTPSFLLLRERIWSFYDLSKATNPLKEFIDGGTLEEITIEEFIELNNGTRELVQLLNDSMIQHLFSVGLRVDTKKKRAYFTKSTDGSPKEISYQGRIKKATRTVAKPRINKITGKVYYWEHKSIWFSFERIGGVWYLLINPAYVFTIDGIKQLLKSEKVNILSTKKASRDYNMSVHNDLTFWASYISINSESVFLLRSNKRTSEGEKIVDTDLPEIVLSSKLPIASVHDVSIVDPFVEPSDLDDIEDIEEELEQLAKEEQDQEKKKNGN